MILRRGWLVLFGVTIVLCCVGDVFPQEMSQEWKWCEGLDGASADLRISGCTTVIQSGRETPENLAIAFYNRGKAYSDKGDQDRAIQDYDQAIRLNPQNASYWNNRCWARALAGQLDRALADCNESLRLRPGDVNTLDSRALVYLKSGRLESAISDYDEALRLDVKKASSLYGRGLAKQKKGDAIGAAADIAAAKAIEADIADKFNSFGVQLR